ncbi:phosphopantothenoylcysteine decarboxylase / phosphopantothenate--cysteine ligase [Quadrisphaera granulorum]|uniref:Coenzyme A biosynthesis bifunctional protein CoaBC n=1 Tax=Quadrisphaera granulorum TaxID=317664 RepID=A0A315ZR15_9ACTN|nr:bifunctional phosphopantothenoylcysteine decarboxylase/phosphopantothenate--cysteine ligase CoaBC [Quadrisphaera granulorum]PWJ48021.1 phosphopantothenoylcysteine decarboxylase/phosphopantothenate--cysteine ligase [Quadrisphaera granulorum]SZE98593.1 phosphopantothenoylcysteine decarboxylase / phosphopantothenate--cysteine ligase [Quadrisphaera granulorum]
MSPARVVLGVGGGIAAYKAALLLRLFTEGGASVRVVPTEAALKFVGEPTWAALSGQPVATGVWSDVHEVPHVRLGREADLVLVAPATADLLGRAAHGLADDLLTNVLLTARCPVLLAPAMHTEMWQHPAVVANVATLRERGIHVLDPDSGRLTGADTGPGRLPEPERIHAAAMALLGGAAAGGAPSSSSSSSFDLAGRHVVVSAGGTREPLDPVRFLGNASSGRQGAALAARALARGARVTYVRAHTEVPDPAGAHVVPVSTALQLRDAVVSAAEGGADVVVMAAAVADFRPAAPSESKIKKSDDDGDGLVVELVRNPDVLAGLVAARREGRVAASTVVVGFAAETGDASGSVIEHGRLKAVRKGADLLVVNEVGGGRAFGTPDNTVVILGADGSERSVGPAPKETIADAVWDAVAMRLTHGRVDQRGDL